MNIGFDVMETLESSVFMSSFVLVVFAVLTSMILLMAKRAIEQRTAEVEGANELLDAHFYSVDKILDDPAVSDRLKDLLLSFSISVTRREIALECAAQVSKEKAPVPREVSDEMKAAAIELTQLGMHRADMREAFTKAVLAGFTSMMLRWPSTRSAVVKLHVANTLRSPINRYSSGESYQENGINEAVDLARRVLTARQLSGGNPELRAA